MLQGTTKHLKRASGATCSKKIGERLPFSLCPCEEPLQCEEHLLQVHCLDRLDME